MVTRSKVLRAAWPALFGLSLGVAACGGDDDKKDDATKGCKGDDCKPGTGFVTKAKDGKIVVDLSEVEAGAQFVLLPFLTGSADKVEGGTDAGTKFTFTAKSGSGSGLKLAPATPPKVDPAAEAMAIEHDMRTLAARFHPALGLRQEEGFWALARSVDARRGANPRFLAGTQANAAETSEGHYREAALAADLRTHGAPLALTTTAGGCPADKLVVPDKSGKSGELEIKADMVVDGDGYCMVYVDAPVTEADKTAIEKSVKTVIDGYKKTIYKNDMAAVGGFTFKPVVVIVDTKDADHWPQVADYDLAGAFLQQMSDDAKQPMLYLAADFSDVKSKPGNGDAAAAKKFFHSVIAHEMQHAVLDYFRRHAASPANPENSFVDEGIAHFMEDGWGYGEENFSIWAQQYLATTGFGSEIFLGTVGGNAPQRGGAHAMMFYLASQKDGVTFADGKMTGGGGLDFITSVVMATSGVGARGLAAKAGGDWTQTVGNYLGALMADGALADAAKAFKTQGPVKGVTDLTGNADKTFGMTFNGYKGMKSASADVQDKLEAAAVTEEVTYYQSKPILYTASGDSPKVTFTLPDGTAAEDLASAAVTAVRIK